MVIFIDNDLLALMKADSYINDFVNCEIDKIERLEKKYNPVSQYINKYDIYIISTLDDSSAYIRLVV